MRKIAKNPGDLLRTTAIVTSLAVILIFSRCKKDNYVPQAFTEVSPLTGEAPLSTRIKGYGTDKDGVEDITLYTVNVDGKDTTGNSPFDFVKVFNTPGTHKIYTQVKDSKGATDKSDVISVEAKEKVLTENITQSASLVGDVNISYSAVLSNVKNAKLTVNKNGAPYFSSDISDVVSSGNDYAKTFTFASDALTKGDYEFVLKSDKLEKKTSVTVPDYASTLDLTGLNFDFNKFTSYDVTLPAPRDKNPDDMPVVVESVKSSDTLRVKPSLNNNVLTLVSPYDTPGLYQLTFNLKSASGVVVPVVVSGHVLDVKLDYTSRPRMNTLNYYGSGDANNDNVFDSKDLDVASSFVAGKYTGTIDGRMADRINVSGSGIPSIDDVQIIASRLSGSIANLPGEWEKLSIAQQKDWITKMDSVYFRDRVNFAPLGGDCNQFSDDFYMQFHGISATDIPKYAEVFNYDFIKNCRFNLPALVMITSDNVANEGHAMNAFILGKFSGWSSTYPVEPQYGAVNVQPGEYYFMGTNTDVYISGPPIVGLGTYPTGKRHVVMFDYIKFSVINNIPSTTWIYPGFEK